MRFSVYKHRFVIKTNLLVTRQFIVLKDDDGTIRFTNFHKYTKSPVNKVKKYSNDGNSRFQFVVQFLNFAFFEAQIASLNDLTAQIVSEFLTRYGTGTLRGDNENTTRTEDTVKRCVRTILDFLENFLADPHCNCTFKRDDLFKYVSKRDKHGRLIEVRVPVFDICYISHPKEIYRDIPNKAFNILFNHIAVCHTELLGLVMNSAFAGLRPSSSCNVRRADSPLGPGILFHIVDGELIKIEIDLRKELNLRSDLLPVGKIKKERMQQVPDIFLNAYKDAYDLYIKYLEGKKYEKDYAPFTINKQGRAITYDSYAQRFRKIVKEELIPIFLASDDPEVAMYGRILMENNLSPHVFRHWFTVQLVLSGISDPGTLMYWRGDTNPESALTYLQNKGELEKQYRLVNNEIFDFMLWSAGKKYG